jgi:hypothetical protein
MAIPRSRVASFLGLVFRFFAAFDSPSMGYLLLTSHTA